MRLLITGANGFIGRAVLEQIQTDHFETIHAVTRRIKSRDGSTGRIIWHEADLFHERSVALLFEKAKPTHVIHGAWETHHGTFWTSEKNRDWLSASMRLLDHFEAHDGRHFIFLGSMAEYDWSEMPLIEHQSAEMPFTLYGETKLAFHRLLMARAAAKAYRAVTGRIFNLYGPDEKPDRLVPQVIGALSRMNRVQVGRPERERDILHVDDVARGILALLRSELTGAVNIANGSAITMGDLYQTLAEITGRGHLIEIGARPDRAGEPKRLYGEAYLIRSTGWRPTVKLEDGLNEIWTRALTRRAA